MGTIWQCSCDYNQNYRDTLTAEAPIFRRLSSCTQEERLISNSLQTHVSLSLRKLVSLIYATSPTSRTRPDLIIRYKKIRWLCDYSRCVYILVYSLTGRWDG